MSLVLLLLISLTTFVQVESQSAEIGLNRFLAQEHARLGALVALGNLQVAAGPDTRATGRAKLSNENSPHPLWTAVWYQDTDPATNDSSKPPAWLVSGNASGALGWNSATPAETYPTGYHPPDSATLPALAELLPATGESTDPLYPALQAPWVDLDGGRFAFAVLDEGVKARFNRRALPPGGDAAYIPAGPRPQDSAPELAEWASLSESDLQRSLELTSSAILAVSPKAGNLRHDLTGIARGLLVNQRDGGLRRNLSAAFANDSDFAKLLDEFGRGPDKNRIFGPQGTSGDDFANPGGPAWTQLREFAGLRGQAQSLGLDIQPETRDDQSIAPVPTSVSLWLHATLIADPGGDPTLRRVRFHYYPVVALWNPFAQKMKGQTLYLLWDLYMQKDGIEGLVLEHTDGTKITAPGTDGGKWNNPLTPDIPRPDNGFLRSRPGAFLVRLEVPDLDPGEIRYLAPDSSGPLSFEVAAIEAGANTLVSRMPTESPLATLTIDSVATLPESVVGTDAWLSFGSAVSNSGAWYLGRSIDELLYRPLGQMTHLVYRGASNKSFGQLTLVESEAAPPIGNSGNSFPTLGIFAIKRFAEDFLETLAPHFGAPRPRLPWLTVADPGAPYQMPTLVELVNFGNFMPSVLWNSGNTGQTGKADVLLELLQSDATAGFGGFSVRPPGQTRPVLWELRAGAAPASLGEFANARLRSNLIDGTRAMNLMESQSRAPSYEAAYSFGNSLAPSWLDDTGATFREGWDDLGLLPGQIVANNLDMVAYDQSYLLNAALWDRFFLTGSIENDPNDDVLFPLGNTALTPTGTPLPTSAAEDYRGTAAALLTEGAFNVNSESVTAWKALLSATFGQTVERAGGTQDPHPEAAPYPRYRRPVHGPADPSTADDMSEAVYGGYRALDRDEIEALAKEIVRELRARGPFRSLADFVNRQPASNNPEHRLNGTLEAAIRAAGINDYLLEGGNLVQDYGDYDQHVAIRLPEALVVSTDRSREVSMADQSSGALTQMDLLARLGPYLTARSDTFRILASGEAIDPLSGGVLATAVCELTVQRLPDWVDPDLESWDLPGPDSINNAFGRRFQVTAFRWLQP